MVSAVQACCDDMRFPSLADSHSASFTRHQQNVAFLADSSLVVGGQSEAGGHCDFSGALEVALGELRVCSVSVRCLLEEDL